MADGRSGDCAIGVIGTCPCTAAFAGGTARSWRLLSTFVVGIGPGKDGCACSCGGSGLGVAAGLAGAAAEAVAAVTVNTETAGALEVRRTGTTERLQAGAVHAETANSAAHPAATAIDRI